MEPISKEKPKCKKICSFCKLNNKNKCKGFLNLVKKITHKNNALLIFDEVVTGFRFSRGGYQSIYGVFQIYLVFQREWQTECQYLL